MTTFFKAVRPDGGSFRDPRFKWSLEPSGVTKWAGSLAESDARSLRTDASFYLSVATVATDCTGMQWPCRLLEVEPIGDVWTPDSVDLPNKRAGLAFRTVREAPACDVFGPQGVHVAALIDQFGKLTREEIHRLRAVRGAARYAAWDAARDASWDAVRYAAWDAARDASWDAAWDAARYAARYAAWDAARYASWDAVGGLVVRDLISTEHYDTLTMPWRTAIGRIHPDDAEVQS